MIRAESITEALAGNGDGSDDKTVAGEGREYEKRHPSADLINVV